MSNIPFLYSRESQEIFTEVFTAKDLGKRVAAATRFRPKHFKPEIGLQQGTGRLNPIKLRQMKERQRSIEDEVTRLEVEIADFEQALSQFQSADQSIEISTAQVAKNANAIERADLRMEVRALHADFGVILREIFGHSLG